MTMDNVTFIELKNLDGTITEHAIIDRGNEEYTSMLKSTYEAQQAAQAQNTTTIIPD
jgi:hypothetical protein